MQRLLPKHEVDRRRAEESRQRMDEGMVIAEKVDILRETLASEEVAFERYRVESLRGIQEDIERYAQERDVLAEEVRDLVSKKTIMEPLKAIWDDAVQRDEQLEQRLSEMVDRELILQEKARILDIREKSTFDKEKAVAIAERGAASREQEAKTILKEAKESAEEVRIQASVAYDKARLKEIEVRKIERSLVGREEALEEREQTSSLKEKELAEQDASLQASWKLLQKTASKLNGN